MEDYYEYLDSNGITTLYKLIKDDTVALIDSYSVTVNGITTTLDTHINDSDIHTPISVIEGMIDTRISGLVNSAPETLDTLKELSDALGNDPNFATTVANQIGNKADKSTVYTKLETDALLEDKSNSVHSHVVNDITDFPTIPTKLSQLENDMGFGTGSGGVITSISWTNITDKPNFSTVAISGSYTDLSNTPTIPTKLSDLTNDSDFATDSNVVHKTGNETIEGVKTFTQGVVIKNNNLNLTVTPTNNIFSTVTFRDKNNANTASLQNSQRTYGVNDICFYVWDADSNSHGFRIRTDNVLEPIANNTYSLGSSSLKWANIYGTNAYIDKVTCTRFTHSVNNGSVYITGGSEYDKGATLVLHGEESSDAGAFIINSRDKTRSLYLVGKPDGTLQWAGQNIALDENLVHRTGNEAISGAKIFLNDIFRKNTSVDLTTTPTGHTNTNIIFADKNDKTIAHFEYVQRSSGVNDVGIFAWDKNGNAHGIHINTNNEVIPLMSSSESYSLGSAAYKWGKIYSNDVVHTSGNENIAGNKMFTGNLLKKNSNIDLQVNPSANQYNSIIFTDKNNVAMAYIEHLQTTSGLNGIGIFARDKSNGTHGIQITSDNIIKPLGDNTYSLGISGAKWKSVYATTFNGNLKGNADTATSAITQATTDNSTKIATTAWVRTYVNSVVGSNTVGSSVSAYWSNSSSVTATGEASAHSSSSSVYPACYSDYVNKTPTVGTIYSGAQLYTEYGTSASATGTLKSQGQYSTRITTTTAQVTFRSPISATGKYLCTTANTIKFRAYTTQGSTSTVGSSSIVDYTITKSIFIRVE